MSATPNLAITYVESAQSQKEVTINEGFDATDLNAGAASIAIVNGANVLTAIQTGNGIIKLTGALTASATVQLDSTLTKYTLIINNTTGGQTVQAKIGSGGTLRTIPAGQGILIWPSGAFGFGGSTGSGAPDYAQQVVVAKDGTGDYSTIQDAINAITDALITKRYIIVVMPGLYTEQVTMKDWVDVRGAGKHSVQIQFTGNNNGTVILASHCQLEDLIIEMTTTSSEWAIVGTNISGWHIRNVDILSASGTYVSQGIKITGSTWATGFLEHSIINYRGTTGNAVLIQGDATTPQMCDCHINDCFVDALAATTGGCIEVKDARDVYVSKCLLRVTPSAAGAFGLKTSKTSATTSYTRVQNSAIEGTNNNALVVNVGTTVYWYASSAESKTVNGTVTGFDYQVQSDLSAEVSATADQALTTSTWTSISMNEEKFDTGAFHDNSTNNTRLTVPIAGRYLIHGCVQFEPNATGIRHVRIIKNGSTSAPIAGVGGGHGDATVPVRVHIMAMELLAAGDYIELQAWQNSGGNLNSQFPDDFAPRFGIMLMR